jgi:hypothetical protein
MGGGGVVGGGVSGSSPPGARRPNPRVYGPTLRVQRLRLVWFLALPFVLLANPSRGLLLVGGGVSLCGLLLRAAAAASIHKERSLAVGGPYAHLRHPLYLGSFLTGLGLALAGGRWFFLPVLLALFLPVYGRAVRTEERTLELLFGEPYRRYRGEVPALIPRFRRYSPPGGGGVGEEALVSTTGPGLGLYLRNKEWQAALGAVAGFGLLWAKAALLGSG